MTKRKKFNTMLLIVLIIAIAIPLTVLAETVRITDKNPSYEYFSKWYNSSWSTLLTPKHLVRDSNPEIVAYCLEHSSDTPNSTYYTGTNTPFSYLNDRTITGLKIIIENGYPYYKPSNLNADQTRYATSNAIRFWLSEEGAPNQYSYTNLKNIDLDTLWQTGNASASHVKTNYNPGSLATMRFAVDLLRLARSQELMEHTVSFTPSSVELTEEGDYFTAQTTVNLTNLNGGYRFNQSSLPQDSQVTGFTGKNGDTLTITIPASSMTNNQTISLAAEGLDNRSPANMFWATNTSYSYKQDVVYLKETQRVMANATLEIGAPEAGYIEINKTDESTEAQLQGAVFAVFDSENNEITQLITDENGYVISSELSIGTYSIVETTAPYGYVLDNNAHNDIAVNANTTTVNISNKAQTGVIRITKTDNETDNAAQGDASLNGAVFEVYDSSDNLIETLDCSDNNYVVSSELPLGTYTVKEITPPAGYLLDAEPQTVTIEYTDQNTAVNEIDVTFSNTVIKGSISIQKTVDIPLAEWTANNEEYPLSGIEFSIVHKSSGLLVDTLVTDNDGFTQSILLPYGTYTITEATYLYGYHICEPFDVIITENDTAYETTVENKAVTSELKIAKTDADTGQVIQTAGTQFEIRDINNNIVTLDSSSVFTTDDTGTVTLPETLPFGEYTLHEITPPYGYWINNEAVSFSVGGTKDDVIIVELADQKIMKTIQVIKTDERDNNHNLEGAVFAVYRGDTLVDTITTSTDGAATSRPLPVGTYSIHEIQAPSGFILHDVSYTVNIGNDQTLIYTFNFTNTPTEITLTKTDEITTLPIAGATIEIYDSSNNPVANQSTDENGQIVVYELPAGDYTFKETLSPKGYTLNETIYSFSIDEKGVVVGDTEFTNCPTALQISKVIYESNEPLAGAGFAVKGNLGLSTLSFVLNSNGTYHYDKDGNINEVMVDDNGIAIIYGLPTGDYWLEETTIPAGYYPCAPTKISIDETQSTDALLEIVIPNSEYVNLGLNKDRWYLPIAISLVGLLSLSIILLIIFRKKKGDKNR